MLNNSTNSKKFPWFWLDEVSSSPLKDMPSLARIKKNVMAIKRDKTSLFLSLSLSFAACDSSSPTSKAASSNFFLNEFHLTIPHMWASEAMCSFIFSKAFLQRFNPTVFQFVWLLYFSIFKKRRQLKQNMASVLGDYSSRRLLYHLFWNDHPSTFFGNDSTGWQGPILSHIRIEASLYFKLNCRTWPGSVGCCSSSRFKEQPLSGFGICILYSVSWLAVPCTVSFVCASTFPLSLHPLSPGLLFPALFLSCVPQHFPLPLHLLSPSPHLIYYFPLSVHLGTRLNLHKMYSQILKSMFK